LWAKTIGDYVGFFSKLMFGFGASFELPVVTFFLAKIGLITDRTLKDFFKYAVVVIFILAALLTPPDVLTQILMAGPMIILYIISIYIAKITNPAPKDE
jgi:sec-independent protein translocase protein TatC